MSRPGYPHVLAIATRWHDNDVYGHVNNVEYYAFFDTVINHWLITEGGLDIGAAKTIGLCAESHCSFAAPVVFPETVDAGLRVARLGHTSVTYEIGLFRQGAREPVAEGWFVHVFVDRETRRPAEIWHPVRARAPGGGRLRTRGAVLREMGLPAPYAASRPLDIVDLELAPPGPGEMLVKVGAAGLCHSDLSVIDGSRPRMMPMVLGHEAAGEVVQLGPGTKGFAPGDHVVLSFVPTCGECPECRGGRAALCEPGAVANAAGALLGGERRWGELGGEALHHHLGVSAFAEHIMVSARSAVRMPDGVPFEIAALFGCAVLTGVGAVTKSAGVEAGQSMAVFGLGGVGLAALLGGRLAGASPLLAVDRVPAKLELARELGASHTVPAGEDAVEQVRNATGGGADHALETVGSEKVLAEAYAATRRGGTTVAVGLPHPERMLSIPALSLVAEERTLKGSYLGSCNPPVDVPRFVDLHLDGRLPVERLLSHRLTLGELNEGFDRLASGDCARQAVVFDQ